MNTEIQETIARLRELQASAPQGPLKVRTGYMSGERATIDITTIDEQYPPPARLWSHPLMGYEQIPPNSAVVEKLVGSYNALPGLLAEIERLTTENKKLSEAWEGGYKTAANLYYEWPSKPEDFAQEAHALSPYKESKK